MAAQRSRKGTIWRLVICAVVLVVLIVPGRILATEHKADDALTAYSGAVTASTVAVGESWHADTGVQAVDGDSLVLVEVRPRMSFDSTDAIVEVQLCTPKPGQRVRVITGSLSEPCQVIASIPGGRGRLVPGGAQLIVTVTARQPGRVRIDGYDVTYIDRGRRGTEYTGGQVRLRAD